MKLKVFTLSIVISILTVLSSASFAEFTTQPDPAYGNQGSSTQKATTGAKEQCYCPITEGDIDYDECKACSNFTKDSCEQKLCHAIIWPEKNVEETSHLAQVPSSSSQFTAKKADNPIPVIENCAYRKQNKCNCPKAQAGQPYGDPNKPGMIPGSEITNNTIAACSSAYTYSSCSNLTCELTGVKGIKKPVQSNMKCS